MASLQPTNVFGWRFAMPHFPKPFFRPSRKLWYVQLEKQVNLGPDRDEAFRRYGELIAKPRPAKLASDSVAVLMDLFLDWCKQHREEHKKTGEPLLPSRSTIHKEIVLIRQILKTAHRHGWIQFVPDLSPSYETLGKSEHRVWFSPDRIRKRAATIATENEDLAPPFLTYDRNPSCLGMIAMIASMSPV
jgi:hypothetical protein